jgi:hypothetical protein
VNLNPCISFFELDAVSTTVKWITHNCNKSSEYKELRYVGTNNIELRYSYCIRIKSST